MSLYSFNSLFPVSQKKLFEWHASPGAFERLNPPWRPVKLKAPHSGIENGKRVDILLPFGPLSLRWLLKHSEHRTCECFRDTQIHGPFQSWQHTHLFTAEGEDCSRLTDSIEYKLPVQPLSALVNPLVTKELNRLFKFRHALTHSDLMLHQHFESAPRLRVLVSGSNGLVGSALCAFLSTGGHSVVRLVRKKQAEEEILWDPEKRQINREDLEGFDAIIHLAGENVARARWNESVKKKIYGSRVLSTAFLVDTISDLTKKPEIFLCASAVGFYGDRGVAELSEDDAAGSGFLAATSLAWEKEAQRATPYGVRVVNTRFGVILHPQGGALKQMMLPFLMGLGGPLGAGNQFMSWIALQDVLGALLHTLNSKDLVGPVNFVAPYAVTSTEFSQTLARVLKRPNLLKAPAFALKIAFGEMANEMLLASTRCVPQKLTQSGYTFVLPNLEDALRFELGV